MLDPALAAVLVKLGRDFRDLTVPEIVGTAVRMFPEPPPLDLTDLERQIRAALARLREQPLLEPAPDEPVAPTEEGWEATRDPVREQEMSWVLDLIALAIASDDRVGASEIDRVFGTTTDTPSPDG